MQSLQTLTHEIERAYSVAKCGAPIMRWSMLLHRLPNHVLSVVGGVAHGDARAAAALIYLAGRVGWLLHGQDSPALGEDDEMQTEELAKVAHRIARDCAREHLRRIGMLDRFSPAPDPFGLKFQGKKAVCQMSPVGLALEGEAKQMLRAACEDDQ
jgi:hypothetical protein